MAERTHAGLVGRGACRCGRAVAQGADARVLGIAVAGMTATVEIKTGRRRVIDYALSPLREVVSQTAHER